jgi:8-oxo-dGTP diphosphatase
MKTLIVAAAVVCAQGRILVTQRKEGVHQELRWEFPGGKVKDGEDPRKALERELAEELGVRAEAGTLFDVVFYRYPEYAVLLIAYQAKIVEGIPRPLECRDLRWVRPEELDELPMPPADEPLVRRLTESARSHKGVLKGKS